MTERFLATSCKDRRGPLGASCERALSETGTLLPESDHLYEHRWQETEHISFIDHIYLRSLLAHRFALTIEKQFVRCVHGVSGVALAISSHFDIVFSRTTARANLAHRADRAA
jgi:hypothetical protein